MPTTTRSSPPTVSVSCQSCMRSCGCRRCSPSARIRPPPFPRGLCLLLPNSLPRPLPHRRAATLDARILPRSPTNPSPRRRGWHQRHRQRTKPTPRPLARPRDVLMHSRRRPIGNSPFLAHESGYLPAERFAVGPLTKVVTRTGGLQVRVSLVSPDSPLMPGLSLVVIPAPLNPCTAFAVGQLLLLLISRL